MAAAESLSVVAPAQTSQPQGLLLPRRKAAKGKHSQNLVTVGYADIDDTRDTFGVDERGFDELRRIISLEAADRHGDRREVDEADIPPEFDLEEDGLTLRLLDRYILCDERTGKPVPFEHLDKLEATGMHVVGYGTVLEPNPQPSSTLPAEEHRNEAAASEPSEGPSPTAARTPRRLRVCLPKVCEWAIDYTVGDPTLWLITDRAWYKVGGPLGGVRPAPEYVATFRSTRRLFEACTQSVRVLMEYMPAPRRKGPLSAKVVIDEVLARTAQGGYDESTPGSWWAIRTPLTERFLAEHGHFIYEQICSLDGNPDGPAIFADGQRVVYGESKYALKIRERADNWINNQEKREAREQILAQKRAQKQAREEEAKRLRTLVKEAREEAKEMARRERENSRIRQRDEARYPMEDLMHHQELRLAGCDTVQWPAPASWRHSFLKGEGVFKYLNYGVHAHEHATMDTWSVKLASTKKRKRQQSSISADDDIRDVPTASTVSRLHKEGIVVLQPDADALAATVPSSELSAKESLPATEREAVPYGIEESEEDRAKRHADSDRELSKDQVRRLASKAVKPRLPVPRDAFNIAAAATTNSAGSYRPHEKAASPGQASSRPSQAIPLLGELLSVFECIKAFAPHILVTPPTVPALEAALMCKAGQPKILSELHQGMVRLVLQDRMKRRALIARAKERRRSAASASTSPSLEQGETGAEVVRKLSPADSADKRRIDLLESAGPAAWQEIVRELVAEGADGRGEFGAPLSCLVGPRSSSLEQCKRILGQIRLFGWEDMRHFLYPEELRDSLSFLFKKKKNASANSAKKSSTSLASPQSSPPPIELVAGINFFLISNRLQEGWYEHYDFPAILASRVAAGEVTTLSGDPTTRVQIWDKRQHRKISGMSAPQRKNVIAYLAERPDAEIYVLQDKLGDLETLAANDRADLVAGRGGGVEKFTRDMRGLWEPFLQLFLKGGRAEQRQLVSEVISSAKRISKLFDILLNELVEEKCVTEMELGDNTTTSHAALPLLSSEKNGSFSFEAPNPARRLLSGPERGVGTIFDDGPVGEKLPSSFEIVHTLGTTPYEHLPYHIKLGVLHWLTNEVLEGETIRGEIGTNIETFFELKREERVLMDAQRRDELELAKEEAERRIEQAAQQAELVKAWAERELKQANQHSLTSPPLVPVTTETMQLSPANALSAPRLASSVRKYGLEMQKATEEAKGSKRRKLDEQLRLSDHIKACNVRSYELGFDRHMRRYLCLFPEDTNARLYVEDGPYNSGAVACYTDLKDFEALMSWLDPRGIRERELLSRISLVAPTIRAQLASATSEHQDSIVRCVVSAKQLRLHEKRCADLHASSGCDKGELESLQREGSKLRMRLADYEKGAEKIVLGFVNRFREVAVPTAASTLTTNGSSPWLSAATAAHSALQHALLKLDHLLVKSGAFAVASDPNLVESHVAWQKSLSQNLETISIAVKACCEPAFDFDVENGGSLKYEEKLHRMERLSISEGGVRMNKKALLQMEDLISSLVCPRGSVMRTTWLDLRGIWRADVMQACTEARLAMLLQVLEDGIDMEWTEAHCLPVDRRSWTTSVGGELRRYIPSQGDIVIFYPEGHAEILDDTRRQIKSQQAAGDSSLPRLYRQDSTPAPGETATLNQNGVCSEAMASSCLDLSERFRSSERGPGVYRVASMQCFRGPVPRDEYPDYDDVISEPIDLTEMTSKASHHQYNDVGSFLEDMSLLSSNAQKYCKEKYKPVALAGQQLFERAKIECDGHRERLASPPPPAPLANESRVRESADIIVEVSLSNAQCSVPSSLVSLDTYVDVLNAPWMAAFREQCSMSLFSGLEEGSAGTTEVKGIVMGCELLTKGALLPWRCLHVIWDRAPGVPTRTNPWDISQ